MTHTTTDARRAIFRAALSRPRRVRVGLGDEQGSVSLWLAVASFALILLVGLVVDVGGQVHTQQRAYDLAAQAARTGGQQILPGAAARGRIPRVQLAAAVRAARAYLAASDMTGSVTLTGGDTLSVRTTGTYRPVFLTVIGLREMTVTGHADAQLIRAYFGEEQ